MSETSSTSSRVGLGENLSDLSPTDFIANKYFPLKDYELIQIYDHHFKIIDELDNIIKLMKRDKVHEEQIDNSEEYFKLKKLAEEYGTRFSRFHVYPFKREIENIKMFLEVNKPMKKGSKEILRQKLTTASKNVIKGLQSYITYTSANNLSVNVKLKEIISLILQYETISKNILIPIQNSVGGNLEILSEKCCEILELINKELEKPNKKVKKISKPHKELNIATNLSMYEPKLGDFPMKSQALARLRFSQILKSKNIRRNGTKKKQVNSSDRSLKPKNSAKDKTNRRIDEVCTTDEIQTEIEKFDLHTCKSKQIIPMKKHTSETSLKSCTKKPVKNIEEKLESSNKNVGFFHFISDADSNKEICKVNEVIELTEAKEKEDVAFPFLPYKKNIEKLTTLNISKNVLKDLRFMMKFQNLKPDLEEQESWNIISRISDSVLEILLEDILEEVFDEDCIDELYKNELKTKKDMDFDACKINRHLENK